MKKLIAIGLISIGLLTGCQSGDREIVKDSSGKQDDVYTYTYTDANTGCEYIVFDWYQGGGASPKLDSKGHPTGCRDLK